MKRVSWTDNKDGFRYELYSNTAGEFIKMVRTDLVLQPDTKVRVSLVYLILRDYRLDCSGCHFFKDITNRPKGNCMRMCSIVRSYVVPGNDGMPIIFIDPLVTNRSEFVYNSLFINSYWKNKDEGNRKVDD